MRNRILCFTLTAICSIALAFSASAANVDRPFTVGAAIGYAVENFNIDPDQDNSFAAQINIGYRWMDALATEFQFDHMRRFDVDNPFSRDSLDVNTYILMFKYYPPFGEVTRAYLGLGVGLMDVTVNYKGDEKKLPGYVSNRTRACGKLGMGLERSISEHWILEGAAGYVGGHDGLDEIDYFTWHVGLKYRF
ncbi:opacity protein-like surface antigen [Desulfobotulus alkaliphilus]|uniref:Opacity protein-like surface antigen n=1 Tax=Desulfobotulus alkaliphilus TaxID=622671 RepID=A0A562RS95_9BACT|nr:porin family protein [Desulfobotulus alkaliphilus]TWI71196.1 opacity protein-like surface antigen [Desulfobotulus alkaliphilus]